MPRKTKTAVATTAATTKIEDIDANLTDPMRIKVINLYKQRLDQTTLPLNSIYEIERSIYHWALTEADRLNIARNWNETVFTNMYLGKSYCVFSNLLSEPSFTEKIASGEILPHFVGDMRPEQMAPEKWESIISTVKDRVKNAYEVRMESMTKNIRCRKCKSNKIFYTEVQTRSADEPMTTIYQCLECNSKWKN